MRILLNRKDLLGFRNGTTGLDLPLVAAKVGNKPATIGIHVASGYLNVTTETPAAGGRVPLTYPAVINR